MTPTAAGDFESEFDRPRFFRSEAAARGLAARRAAPAPDSALRGVRVFFRRYPHSESGYCLCGGLAPRRPRCVRQDVARRRAPPAWAPLTVAYMFSLAAVPSQIRSGVGYRDPPQWLLRVNKSGEHVVFASLEVHPFRYRGTVASVAYLRQKRCGADASVAAREHGTAHDLADVAAAGALGKRRHHARTVDRVAAR